MRTFTTEHTVYKFDELTNEAQERALSDYRQNNDYPFLADEMEYHLEVLLDKYGLTYDIGIDSNPKIQYSLSYCQGDGAMFTGVVSWKSYTAIIGHSGHYYHYNSKTIDLTSTKTDKEASEQKYNEFNDIYVSLCQELEKYGYDCIEASDSEGNIIDNIIDCEYEFYADGSVA